MEKFDSIGTNSAFISEITLAELKFGVAKSKNTQHNQHVLNDFLTGVQVLPIIDALDIYALDIYALEKARLQAVGLPVDDFDILIGASAIANNMVLVTNNEKHFARLEDIIIENWIVNN